MGSMNPRDWISLPRSSAQFHTSQFHHLPQGLVNDTDDHSLEIQECNLINSNGGDQVPKVADSLGANKSENQQGLTPYNQTTTAQSTVLDIDLNRESSDVNVIEVAPRSLDTSGQRSSIYRGVTRHKYTRRYEAHLWDNSCVTEGQSRKGRQVYLGGYDKEEKAARAFDLASLKYWGIYTTTNFPINNYEMELEEMRHMTREEYVLHLRRNSSGFARGSSVYRGVTRHHKHGGWQARIGRVTGIKDLYLGTFSTEEGAAEAYDMAVIKFMRGKNAVTNFDLSRYDVKSILEDDTVPPGGGPKKRLRFSQAIEYLKKRQEMEALDSSSNDGSSRDIQGHPLTSPIEKPKTLLNLLNQKNSECTQESRFHPNHYRIQNQLHQHPTSSSLHFNSPPKTKMNGPSLSVTESNESSVGNCENMMDGATSYTVNARNMRSTTNHGAR